MATQNPLLQPGQRVQYNVTTQNPRATLPSQEEQGIGVIRQAFTRGDGAYYQVVWNPGDATPKSALYHEDQLCPVDAKTTQGMGGTPGSNFVQPNIPIQAAPPEDQQTGMETL